MLTHSYYVPQDFRRKNHGVDKRHPLRHLHEYLTVSHVTIFICNEALIIQLGIEVIQVVSQQLGAICLELVKVVVRD